MGASMYAGDSNSLHTRDACHLVNSWVDEFEEPGFLADVPWDEQCGIFDHTAEAVQKANATVPEVFGEAARLGFVEVGIVGARVVNERDFRSARSFLRRAADLREGLSGSY